MSNITLIWVITHIQVCKPRETMKEGGRKGKYRQYRWNYALLCNLGNFVSAFAKLRRGTISFIMSVCLSVRPSARNNSAPTGRIFMKFDIWGFFENLSRKFKCKNTVQPDKPRTRTVIIPCRQFACWIPKVKNTHSEYVIFIDFSRLQWFRVHAS